MLIKIAISKNILKHFILIIKINIYFVNNEIEEKYFCKG